ncbi:hypothetical protein CHLRE_01g046652v5 [Chlamydomonas reinhardtii]|uniref:tRNA-binding domain-containing protein n=1 Tax=Chlamydomonas reinhardtii TaxID=3055 RepID=A0A2K3E7P6_CHLRE|nr:uncharacterized protein CHLRE_01g046652v5 [Chlamydomonas reinhardtii]PNW88805.1 hypothetical protein CHLRE_01g046652v5 [Chlamydomonas reinhardtii]
MASQMNVRRSAGQRQSQRSGAGPCIVASYRLTHHRGANATPYGQACLAIRVQEQRREQSLLMCRSTPVEAPAAPAAEAPTADADPASMDIRVGKIVKVEKHPEADSLYVEQIDVGEPEPRTIVSGLVKFVPVEEMQDRKVIVLCNLKARNMRGIKSNGMVLCASNDAHDVVEPLAPPAEAPVGERVYFGEAGKTQAAPAEPNRVQKKKLWEAVQPLLKTDSEATARFKDDVMFTSAGPVRAASLKGATIA